MPTSAHGHAGCALLTLGQLPLRPRRVNYTWQIPVLETAVAAVPYPSGQVTPEQLVLAATTGPRPAPWTDTSRNPSGRVPALSTTSTVRPALWVYLSSLPLCGQLNVRIYCLPVCWYLYVLVTTAHAVRRHWCQKRDKTNVNKIVFLCVYFGVSPCGTASCQTTWCQ